MASIQKRSKHGNLYAFFRDELGNRACRCTNTTDRGAAMSIALSWERAAAEARRGTLTVEKSRKVLNEMLSLTGQAIDQESTEDFAARWLAGKQKLKATRTAERYAPIVKRFVTALGPKAKLPLSSITAADLERHRDTQISAGKGPTSVRLEMKTLSALFNHALRQGHIQNNPVSAVELDESTASTKEPFTPEEVKRLLIAAEGTQWETAILLASLTGLRLGDVSHLRWSAIQLSPPGEEKLTVRPEKTIRRGKVVVLPLHSSLVAKLTEMAGVDEPDAFVFPDLPKRTGGSGGLSIQFAKIMDAAQIDRQFTSSKGVGRRVSNKSFHSLRHYTATELLNAGVDEALRVKIVGHSSAAMNRRYSHTTDATLRGAISKLPTPSK